MILMPNFVLSLISSTTSTTTTDSTPQTSLLSAESALGENNISCYKE